MSTDGCINVNVTASFASCSDSQQLLESYITALCQGRARSAVTSFMRRVVPNSSSPNVFTFERLLENCSRSNQLSRGINTFTCMTRTYGIAPTRNVCEYDLYRVCQYDDSMCIIEMSF